MTLESASYFSSLAPLSNRRPLVNLSRVVRINSQLSSFEADVMFTLQWG